MSYRIISPRSAEELEKYFDLRYKTLSEPWNQPRGSEKDAMEDTSVHAMLIDPSGEAAGVCRLQFNSPETAQLRYMGIRSDLQGKGLGDKLLVHLEEIAKDKGAKTMILEAREPAVSFYQRNGYQIIKKSYLMWDLIQHYTMQKEL